MTRSSRHTVNSSPVNSSHSCIITQSTRHKWTRTMLKKAIRCWTDSTQKVLNTDGIITSGKQTRRHTGKGVLKINDLKNISQLTLVTTVTAAAWAERMCHHLLSAISDRPSAVTFASYYCAMALSLCRVTTDVFEQRVQTLIRMAVLESSISTVNWRSYAWL